MKVAEVQPVNVPFVLRVEAEAAQNQITGFARRTDCGPCSGNEGVADLGWGNFLISTVSVPVSGVYRLTVRYSLGFMETRSGLIYVNDYPVAVIHLPWSEGWDKFLTASVAIKLQKGLNKIQLGNPSNWFVNMDYFELSSDLSGIQHHRFTLLPNRPVFVLADISQIWVWIVWLICGIVVGAVAFWKIVSQHGHPWFKGTALSLALIVFFVTLTLTGYLLELLDLSLVGSWIGYNIWNCSISLVAVSMLWFSLSYTGNLSKPRRSVYWLGVLYAIVIIAVYSTDPWTHLIQQSPKLTLERSYLPLDSGGPGAGQRFFFSVSVIAIFMTGGILISSYRHLSTPYRKQIQALVVATVLPYMVGYTLGWLVWQRIDIGQINLYAIGIALSNWFVAYAVFNLRLPELIPSLWGAAQHIPSDLAIAIDQQNRIVETNSSARERLGIMVGQTLPDPLNGTVEEFRLSGRIYQCKKQLIEADIRGELIVLHDITDRVQVEHALLATNQELQQLRDELRNQANHDALTGLFNRRYLDQQFTLEVERATVQNTDLSVVLFDIDYFRDINSRFGYAGGDDVLRRIGALVAKKLSGETFACRFGGEEFCVILPEASLEQAETFAKELQNDLRNCRLELNGKKLNVEISAACASLYENTGQDLLLAVDETLRQAKQTGRNKVLRAKPWNLHWGTGWV